jgi:hypothetical protein
MRAARLPAPLLAVALIAGCAHIEELPDGSKRVTGFVRMTVPSAIPDRQRGGEMVEVTSFGVSVLSAPTASRVSVGYANDRITTLRNNAVVHIRDQGGTP